MTKIDVANDALLPIASVVGLIPSSRPGKKLHPATIHRWILRGVRGHRLAASKIGATWYTSRAALADFIEALNGDTGVAPQVRTQRQRQADRRRAAARLDAAGV